MPKKKAMASDSIALLGSPWKETTVRDLLH